MPSWEISFLFLIAFIDLTLLITNLISTIHMFLEDQEEGYGRVFNSTWIMFCFTLRVYSQSKCVYNHGTFLKKVIWIIGIFTAMCISFILDDVQAECFWNIFKTFGKFWAMFSWTYLMADELWKLAKFLVTLEALPNPMMSTKKMILLIPTYFCLFLLDVLMIFICSMFFGKNVSNIVLEHVLGAENGNPQNNMNHGNVLIEIKAPAA